MIFFKALGSALFILIVIYTIGYILACITAILRLRKEIPQKITDSIKEKEIYSDYQSNTGKKSNNQRYILKAITECIKKYPISFYLFYWQYCVRGKPIDYNRANKGSNSNPNITPNPINIELPNTSRDAFHGKSILQETTKNEKNRDRGWCESEDDK